MSTEQNKAVLRRWMEGWNTKDVNVMDKLADELYTADCIFHHPLSPSLAPGPEGVRQFVRHVLKNSPDRHSTIEDLVAEGDRVASRLEVRGTDASSGKPETRVIMAISRFVDGKIAERWQLGVLTVEAQP